MYKRILYNIYIYIFFFFFLLLQTNLCFFICMYVCMCVCIYVSGSTRNKKRQGKEVIIHTYVHTYIHTYIQSYIHTYILSTEYAKFTKTHETATYRKQAPNAMHIIAPPYSLAASQPTIVRYY